MGSYTFRWPHPAEEVFVTGTFDNWGKSTQLEKTGDVFEKSVDLPKTDDKILYKFVVDGTWIHDHEAKTEKDHEGNENNVLNPEDLSGAAISSVGPGATTLGMAGEQPVEDTAKSAPGAFPETPAAGDQEVSVNPIPASGGISNPIQLAPGETVPPSSSINDNTVTSGVHDDPELKSKDEGGDQTVSVAPIPATGGIGNPIQLAPGEKVPDPSTITDNTVDSTVKTDKESYEKSDAAPPENTQASSGTALAGEQTTGNIIPESSLPMGEGVADVSKENTGPTISSVGPESTTAQLAGEQPIEPRGVPTVVSESQQEAGVDPEASANPEAVEEKKEVEDEFMKKVPEEEPAKEDGVGAKVAAGVGAAGVAAAGAAVAANEVIKDKTGTDPKESLPEGVKDTVEKKAEESDIPAKAAETTGASGDPTERQTTATVPDEVKESEKEAGVEGEAAANPEAVQEKSEVEKELLSKVPESEAKGEPAPTDTAATTTTAPATTTETTTSPSGAPQLGDPTNGGLAPITMDDAKPSDDAKPAETATEQKTEEQSKPEVTTGVASSTTPAKNGPGEASTSTPATSEKRKSIVDRIKGTPGSSTGAGAGGAASPESSKKEKRRSIFGRIKDKLKA